MSNQDVPTLSIPLGYKNLRGLFVAGLAIQLILLFIPSYRATVGSFFGFGGEERSLTNLDIIRLLFRGGETAWGLLNAFVYSAFLILLILAFRNPARWVFIAGAMLVTFCLMLELFIGNAEGIEYYMVPRILYFVSLALPLAGFWIKPISQR